MVEGRATVNANLLITHVISTVKVLETYLTFEKLAKPTVIVNELVPISISELLETVNVVPE